MNLHKKCFSISKYHKGKGWRVWKHATDLYLTDVTFKVSAAGNKRARESGVRNVHAYAYGTLAKCDYQNAVLMLGWTWDRTLVMYNPFKYTSFVKVGQEDLEVLGASEVAFSTTHGVQARGAQYRRDDVL